MAACTIFSAAARCQTAHKPRKRVGDAEADEAIRKRLRRRPLVLTAHARERLTTRGVTEADVAHVLATGALNRALSVFGGKQMFVLEGRGVPGHQDCAAEGGNGDACYSGSSAASPGPRHAARQRRLRVLFAPQDNATVVVSAIDLEGD